MLVGLASVPTSAVGQLGPDGSPITTSNYTIDLTYGVVISTSRVVGLAGAAASLAQGVEGGLQNPSAVAYRGPQWPDWYDYWLAFGVTYPFSAGDFYNSGRALQNTSDVALDNIVFLIPGAYFQLWNLGIGLTIESQFVRLSNISDASTGQAQPLRLRFTTFHVQAGYGFWDGQLMIGGGLRILRQRVFVSDSFVSSGDSYRTIGLGAELGLMLRPHHKRWSLGASLFPRFKTQLERGGRVMETPEGNILVGDLYVPQETTLPWMGGVGFSYQFGPRPPNPPWISAEELAAPELERLKRRQRAAKEAEAREIEAVRARGGPDVEICVRAVQQKYERKDAKIKQSRKELKKLAWEILRKRYRQGWPRRYYLLTADLGFTGRVTEGVGVESFAFQTVQRSGQKVTVSPRLGFEAEVWPRRMKVRAGSYVEPSRFADSTARVHGTFGFDINVLNWNVFRLWPDDYRWQISVAIDLAQRYGSFSAGIGGWY